MLFQVETHKKEGEVRVGNSTNAPLEIQVPADPPFFPTSAVRTFALHRKSPKGPTTKTDERAS